jgi:hypothetical protein
MPLGAFPYGDSLSRKCGDCPYLLLAIIRYNPCKVLRIFGKAAGKKMQRGGNKGMSYLRTMALAMTAIILTGFLTGCPLRDTNVFRIWLVNASNEFEVTSVEIVGESVTREILGDGEVPTGETGVLAAIQVNDFDDETVTIIVRGVMDGAKGVFDAEASVEVPDPIVGGLTVPLVVTGDTSINYDVEYYPLSANAKLQMAIMGGM